MRPSDAPVATRIAAQLRRVEARLRRGADVGGGHDLDERHAGPVVVDEGVVGVVDATAAADVRRLAGVFFHMGTLDAYPAVVGQLQPAVDIDGRVVLADLIVLGHVRVEVILAVEQRRPDLAVERQPDAHGELHGAHVEHGERAGQAEAHRADVGVGLVAEGVAAPAEQLGLGVELAVDLEPDDRLPGCLGRSVGSAHAARTRGGARGRGPGLEHRRDLEHDGLAQGGGEDLHPDGQPARIGAVGDADGGVAGQVRGDRAHVGEVHGPGVVGLGTDGEGGGGRGGAEENVEVLIRGGERIDDERAHLLGLVVIGVVVPRRQGVGAEHDAPLDLGAEARGRVAAFMASAVSASTRSP